MKKIQVMSLLFLSIPLLAGKKSGPFCANTHNWIHARRCFGDDRKPAFRRRVAAACLRTLGQPKNNLPCQGNGDERNVPDFAAQFSKGLEHSSLNGLLTPNGATSYETLLAALKTGSQDLFNDIDRAGFRKLTNPQGGLTFSLEGDDSSSHRIETFPNLSSPEAAAFLIELYLMALCRDVFFSDYGTGQGTDSDGQGGSLTNNAACILNDLGAAYTGPRNQQGNVDASVLFRGSTYGNMIGPYISQYFLCSLLTLPYTLFPPQLGLNNLPQSVFQQMAQLRPIAGTREFGVSYSDFVAIQNGTIPQPYQASDYNATETRYISDGRDMASYVHWDVPYEEYYNALNILFCAGCKYSLASPYSNGSIANEDPFSSFGIFDVYGLLGLAMAEAGKASWAQKWRAYRVLRPEALAGLVHNAKVSMQNPFNLDSSFFDLHCGFDLLALVLQHNQNQGASTYLLGQVYPEASPLHPSYPSAHGTVAGACITIIKAFMDDTALLNTILTPVKPDPNNPSVLIPLNNEGENQMTVGSELDKLAFNVANGRNFAGIHYRADAEQGVLLGEAVAILLLQDHAATITEQTFTGYELTKIDGTRIRITAENVTPL